jgi:ABC-2 type transport system permease protein
MKSLSIIKNRFSDTLVMSGRSMRHTFRSADTLLTVIAVPIMMMLMFVYVFGGAINTGSVDYINYIVPGIILMCIGSGVAYTALNLNTDVTKGIFDRFHSMPIAKSALLTGHILNSVVFNAISTIIVVLVALLVGFRPNAGIIEWLLFIGIMLLYTFAMTWLSVIFGLLANSVGGATAFSYPLLFLPFVSSAFVPTTTMPGVVRAFAENQPLTSIIETMRSLLLNGTVGNSALNAVLWCVGIIIAAYLISMQVYKRKLA